MLGRSAGELSEIKLVQSRSAERKMKVKFGVAFIIHESRHKNKGETECRTEGGAKPDGTRGFLTSIHDYINNRESSSHAYTANGKRQNQVEKLSK